VTWEEYLAQRSRPVETLTFEEVKRELLYVYGWNPEVLTVYEEFVRNDSYELRLYLSAHRAVTLKGEPLV